MSGDDGAGWSLGEFPDPVQRFRPASEELILLAEDRGQDLPGQAARSDALGLAPEGGRIPKVAVEESAHFAEIVQIVVDERVFLRGVDAVRPRGTVVGYDGLRVTLPVGSTEIRITDLN